MENMAPRDYAHVRSDMSNLVTKLKSYDDEMHIIMEGSILNKADISYISLIR